MNVAWYLGFGWTPIIFSIGFGIASYYYAEGWIHWLLYALFAATVAYMVTKFRLYLREPWRRVHHRGMNIFSTLATQKDDKDVNMLKMCRQLADSLLGPEAGSELSQSGILTDDGRKSYYRELVESYPVVFIQKVPEEKQTNALSGILKDIELSELGPDIIIVAAIEKKYGRLEAARYLLALATGVTAQNSLFS